MRNYFQMLIMLRSTASQPAERKTTPTLDLFMLCSDDDGNKNANSETVAYLTWSAARRD